MLESRVTVEANAYAINVDSKPAVALKDEQSAKKALTLLRSFYESKIDGRTSESRFKENVFVAKDYVPVPLIRNSADDAANYLQSEADPPVVHTIQPGDRAVKLAVAYGVPISELKALNPKANLDRLVEGDQLIIRRAKPLITVVTRSLVTKSVTVEPPAKLRRYRSVGAGRRAVRMYVVYENGQPVSNELISQVTTWDRPKNQREYGGDDAIYSRQDGTDRRSRGYRRYRHYRHYSRYRRQPSTVASDSDTTSDTSGDTASSSE
jgi:LysM repeat protein